MVALIACIVDICLLRRGPQDLPASRALLVLSLTAYVLVGMGLLAATDSPVGPVIPALADTALMVVFIAALLRLRGYSERLAQSLSALAATGTLLTVIAAPLSLQLAAASAERPPEALLVIAWWLVLFWSIAVVGHILRHALALPMSAGLALAVALTALDIAVYAGLHEALA